LPSKPTGRPRGRPVTVDGTEQINVRLSPDLLAKVRAVSAAEHVSVSESLRLVMQLLIDSPGDMLTAMVRDPEAVRVSFVGDHDHRSLPDAVRT
jgi:hypothetical protein